MSNNIDIILVDDHAIMTDGYEKIISDNTGYRVIAKAESGKKLIQLLNSHKPHLIILDLNMPEMDGVETATFIKRKYPSIKILVISMYEDVSIKNKLLAINVEGYISKTTNATELLATIASILNDEKKVYNINLNVQIPTAFNACDTFRIKHKLSEREMEIIALIKEGKTSKDIGRILYLSEFTVETHRKNIFKKTNVKSVGELIKWATSNYL